MSSLRKGSLVISFCRGVMASSEKEILKGKNFSKLEVEEFLFLIPTPKIKPGRLLLQFYHQYLLLQVSPRNMSVFDVTSINVFFKKLSSIFSLNY